MKMSTHGYYGQLVKMTIQEIIDYVTELNESEFNDLVIRTKIETDLIKKQLNHYSNPKSLWFLLNEYEDSDSRELFKLTYLIHTKLEEEIEEFLNSRDNVISLSKSIKKYRKVQLELNPYYTKLPSIHGYVDTPEDEGFTNDELYEKYTTLLDEFLI